jgi:PD-(D/E)XK nuclease superfamily
MMGPTLLSEPQLPASPKAEARLTSYRFWERFQTEELRNVHDKLGLVIDDRERQLDLFAPAAAVEETGGAQASPAGVADPLGRNDTLGVVLSPSQINTYLSCSARWWYRYGLGLPDQRGGSLVRGAAVDKTVTWALRQKKDGVAYEIEDAGAIYEAAWDDECETASFDADEDPEALKRSGAILARKYL